MKTRINPALGIGILVVAVLVIGFLFYRANTRQQVDTSASLSPELRAKIMGAYGGASPSRGPAAPASGSR
jgi:hypothetical protein